MTPDERMQIGIDFLLSDAVLEERIDMGHYAEVDANHCMTSGCRAGWMTQCRALQKEGYTLGSSMSATDPLSAFPTIRKYPCDYMEEEFLYFFGLSRDESYWLFSPNMPSSKTYLKNEWARIQAERATP